MIRNPLRKKFLTNEATHGIFVTLESPTVTEIAVTLGLDWVCVDMEHGHLDFREVMEHIRVVRGSDTAVLVRVPEVQQGSIKRVLDIGAHGVLLPLVRTVEDVEQAISFGRYPSSGVRGVGGERAVKWGLGMEEYLSYANEETLMIPLIETKEAAENIDAILQLPGIEAIFFGPADLSASHGYLGQWEGPGMAELILEIKNKAAVLQIASGVMGRNNQDLKMRQEQGFRMVGLGSDVGLMIKAISESMQHLGKDTKKHLWF